MKRAVAETQLALKTVGAKFHTLDEKTILEADLGRDSKQFVGYRYQIDSLPKPVASGGGSQTALVHPEMAEYKKKLDEMGFKLVVDSTLQTGNTGGYLDGYNRVLAIAPNTKWTVFKHEFQHAEFENAIGSRIYSDYYKVINQQKSLVELWGEPGGPVEKLGKAKIQKIERMMKAGHDETAINEALAVDQELKAMGWKRFIPVMHAKTKDYAYSFQVQTEGMAGRIARAKRNGMWAGETTAVAGSTLALTGNYSHLYNQIIYNSSGDVIAQKKDGTWVRFGPQK